MATMRREFLALPFLVLVLLHSAHGQQLVIKPGVDVTATATTNASPINQAPRKDLVINVSPELSVSYGGTRSRIDGRLKVDNLHYSRDSQLDRTLPSGELILHSDLVDQWGGLEASVETRQIASPLDQSAIPNSYTTTKALISPFIEHDFDANTKLKAQFEKSIIKSSEVTQKQAPVPDLHASQYSARLERQPTPIGASLEWTAKDSEAATTGLLPSKYTYKENAVRAGATYALNDQLHAGLILGRESIRQEAEQQSDTIRGITLDWRPNERAALNSRIERRFFGTGWKVDWNHRRLLFNWGFTSERTASTYASSVGRAVPVTNDGQPASLDPAFSLAASLRQTFQGHMVFVGQRQSVTLASGMDKVEPLPLGPNSLAIGAATQQRYVEALFNRRLTPLTSLNTSLRWTRSSVDSTGALVQPTFAQTGQTRTILWRGDINTKLSQQATATFGLRHQNATGSQQYGNDESAMFVSLGYHY
ncbi:TIGR03016 family PEP-CTERM system-associated outer membrane protein [Aquabacterium sp.]|uniref:TIGR03016 family PEP-CTERM system-associated outer membrane protein n=1 Tax=Aquabacterium sp. TaxID=1872578 RepID=UPI00199ED422|nr:TIGR03016 family PEP-CTERM system-associated outer membrane protein [Aquabacterium sp.]MBC7700129.1 TIGR03016 family PEP-CTERM system-associated outer membrane protein [Aquabacterium sp.]